MEMIDSFERESVPKKGVKFDEKNGSQEKEKQALSREVQALQSARMSRNIGQSEGANCLDHGLPLNFWQEKEQVYACIKCLIDEGEVHFVDKSYE